MSDPATLPLPENPADRRAPPDLAPFAPDAARQQAEIDRVRARDAFNWCYDPFHYTVPEGSYATDPDGVRRIVEFRAMVQALNRMGLRVVMDVVPIRSVSVQKLTRSPTCTGEWNTTLSIETVTMSEQPCLRASIAPA